MAGEENAEARRYDDAVSVSVEVWAAQQRSPTIFGQGGAAAPPYFLTPSVVPGVTRFSAVQSLATAQNCPEQKRCMFSRRVEMKLAS